MPRVEKKVDISAPQDRIFKIIDEDNDYARWNIVVNEVTELGPGNYFFKTNVWGLSGIDGRPYDVFFNVR